MLLLMCDHGHLKSLVVFAMNSGPLSNESSSGMPHVTKILHRLLTKPLLRNLLTIGQLE